MHPVLFTKKVPYYLRAKALFGSSVTAYWPLWEASGSTINDVSGNARHGAYGAGAKAPTLAQPGIGDGKTCPSFDGGDVGDVYSAGFVGAFNGSEGSLFAWARISDDAVWQDATYRQVVTFSVDSSNTVQIYKGTTNYRITFGYNAGGTSKSVNATVSVLTFFHIGLVWSHAGDYMKAYVNGAQSGGTQTGLGDWSGTLASTKTVIGAGNTTPSSPWIGYLAHVLVLSRPATLAEIAKLAFK